MNNNQLNGLFTHFMPFFAVFELSKINYARTLMIYG